MLTAVHYWRHVIIVIYEMLFCVFKRAKYVAEKLVLWFW